MPVMRLSVWHETFLILPFIRKPTVPIDYPLSIFQTRLVLSASIADWRNLGRRPAQRRYDTRERDNLISSNSSRFVTYGAERNGPQ
jgi:hypothetical protein